MLNSHQESGATAIFVAISMLLLIGMAAIAVDVGAGFNERRQDQTASDLAAVAGGLSYGSTQSNESIVTAALDTARANLTAQFSGPNDPAWVTAWRSCQDPDALPTKIREPLAWAGIAGANPGNELECISLSPSFLRVKTPVQDTETTFARVLGFSALQTDADTIVTYGPAGSTGLLPFAVEGGTPSGEICLDTGSSPEPPCDKNDRGSFGVVLPPQWGEQGWPQYCPDNGNGDRGLAAAIANGMDHLVKNYLASEWALSPFNSDPTGTPSRSEVFDSTARVDICSENAGALADPADLSPSTVLPLPIDALVVDTGNSTKAEITQGLVSDLTFYGESSLLQQSGGKRYVTVYDGNNTWSLDNTALWEFLVANGGTNDATPSVVVNYGANAPSSCNPVVIAAGTDEFDRNNLMADCLLAYENGLRSGSPYTQIFLDSIIDAPRFGVAPQLWNDNLGTGLSYRPVERFRPVYIAGIFFRGQGTDLGKWYTDPTDGSSVCFDKGSEVSPPGCDGLTVDQTTAYLLPLGSFSSDVGSVYPGFDSSSIAPTIWE